MNDITMREKATPGDPGTEAAVVGPTVRPLVDIHEGEEGFLIQAEIPGTAEEDIELLLEDGELLIRGPRGFDDGGAVIHDELGPLVWERRFRISAAIDATHVSATLEHGVLRVHLPRSEATRPRRVEVVAAT